jgi:hypothetical protein
MGDLVNTDNEINLKENQKNYWHVSQKQPGEFWKMNWFKIGEYYD